METQHKKKVADLPNWQLLKNRNAIHRRIIFADFNQAFGFLTQVSLYAEKINHHPEIFNVNNQVDITLTTHDMNAVTDLDIAMANFIDGLVYGG